MVVVHLLVSLPHQKDTLKGSTECGPGGLALRQVRFMS